MPTAPPTFGDRVRAGLLQAVAGLPAALQKRLAGRPVELDGQRLHPEIQLVLRLLELDPAPDIRTLSPPEARLELARTASLVSGRQLHVDRVEPLTIPGPAGAIPARLYEARGAERRPPPLLVYFHGGGWVRGDLDTHDNLCRFLAREAGVIVLSVDYRLAPEDRFPAAVDDALAAFRFGADNAKELGADPRAVAVGGDSAGANLTAAVSQLAAAEGEAEPAFTLMFYPATDFSAKRRSYELFADGFLLTEAEMDWYRGHYLPDSSAALDPRASPLLADDVSGLAPAYIATAGFDVLRDEGEQYAQRLQEAGVAVALRRHSGLIHGFANAVGVGRTGRAALLEAAGALRVGVARASAGSTVR